MLEQNRHSAQTPHVTFWEAFLVWAKIGMLSFGGPAGQIALMHREVVEKRKWLDEENYLSALNFCMLLPGPEAMQLATYTGWRLHGVLGGLAAGLMFVLPGACVVLALSIIYVAFGNIPIIETAFFIIKAFILVIVIEALIKISKRTLHHISHWLIAALAFVAIFFFTVPYPLIIISAALAGVFLVQQQPQTSPQEGVSLTHPWDKTLITALTWVAIWIIPLLSMRAVLGGDHILTQLGFFFSTLAVVTFGGAYAVLAYMGQAAVETHSWLSASEMLDGLGLAETTPGPLILVTEFVGYLASARIDGTHNIWLGIAGVLVTLWATFIPCFLFIFTGAPYVQYLTSIPKLKGALQGIVAAVVGIILNLSIWFALHVFSPGIQEKWYGPLRYWELPASGLDTTAVLLCALAAAFALRHYILWMFGVIGLYITMAVLWIIMR
ncbi:MAG: chromate efflux transporter [Pseudomonadota bacterium]